MASAIRRRFLILCNPATGQINPLTALMEELVQRGHQVILSSSSHILKKAQKLQLRVGQIPQPEEIPSDEYLAKNQVVFYSLGSSEVMEDYTNKAMEHPERFQKMCRSAPGDIWGWLDTFTELVPGASSEYRDVVFFIRDLVEALDPDMIIVDNFSPFAVDGVRLTKRPFIETSPGAAAAVASNVNIFSSPIPMSGARTGSGDMFVLFRNFIFMLIWLKFIFFNPWPARRRQFRKEVLGLPSTDIICDSIMTPTPGMLPQQVATISFNVAGMDVYPAEAYDKSVYFVGPCFPPKQISTPAKSLPSSPNVNPTPLDFSPSVSVASTPTIGETMLEKEMFSMQTLTRDYDPVMAWLDRAHLDGKRVLYINMGSIFYYTRKDYDSIVQALKMLHDMYPNTMVLWKIPKLPFEVQPLPTPDEDRLPLYIRREDWLPSVESVLSHPAVAVCMHHGGGNSYNEALAYGVPQFCVSQWVDTHDIGLCIQNSGVGLWAEKSPFFDPSDMSTKLAQLLEDQNNKFRNTALSWKLKASQAGGTKSAADIIEGVVSSYQFANGSSKTPMLNAI